MKVLANFHSFCNLDYFSKTPQLLAQKWIWNFTRWKDGTSLGVKRQCISDNKNEKWKIYYFCHEHDNIFDISIVKCCEHTVDFRWFDVVSNLIPTELFGHWSVVFAGDSVFVIIVVLTRTDQNCYYIVNIRIHFLEFIQWWREEQKRVDNLSGKSIVLKNSRWKWPSNYIELKKVDCTSIEMISITFEKKVKTSTNE